MVTINPIQIENAKPGTAEWRSFPVARNSEIEGYASKTSVALGSSILFYVNVGNPATDPQYALTIYRLGWYKGMGARKMVSQAIINSIQQNIPTPDLTTGLIQANWIKPYKLAIPSDWVSGVYIATLVSTKGKRYGRYIPFVVTDPNRFSDYIFQRAVTTEQAYNGWGGKSLYGSNSTNKDPARKVSFNRPLLNGYGAGFLFLWEYNMIRFLEKEGYDVSYQTDIDTHQGNGNLLKHKALLVVGHDEYWTHSMRQNVENALDHGVSLGNFSANSCYWQIRLEDSNRTIIAYKAFAMQEDPYALDKDPGNDGMITTQWRAPPVNRPENLFLGVMYAKYGVNSDIVVNDGGPLGKPATHWIYSGTHLNNGDKLPGLLGYEIDSYGKGNGIATTEIVAHSPVIPSISLFSDMVVYTKNCAVSPCASTEATTFSTGSMQWNWGLDSFNKGKTLENSAAKQITRNVLAHLIDTGASPVLEKSNRRSLAPQP